MLLQRGAEVVQCEGSDREVMDRAVDGCGIPFQLFLASSI